MCVRARVCGVCVCVCVCSVKVNLCARLCGRGIRSQICGHFHICANAGVEGAGHHFS